MGIFRRRLNDYEVEQRKNKEKKTLTKHSSLFARRSEANDGSPPKQFAGTSTHGHHVKASEKSKKSKKSKGYFLAPHSYIEYFGLECMQRMGFNTPKARFVDTGQEYDSEIAVRESDGYIPIAAFIHTKKKNSDEEDIDPDVMNDKYLLNEIYKKYRIDFKKQVVIDIRTGEEYKISGNLFASNIGATIVGDMDFQPEQFNVGLVRIGNRFYAHFIDKEQVSFEGKPYEESINLTDPRVSRSRLFESASRDQQLAVIHQTSKSLERGEFDQIFSNPRIKASSKQLEILNQIQSLEKMKQNIKKTAHSAVEYHRKKNQEDPDFLKRFEERERLRGILADEIIARLALIIDEDDKYALKQIIIEDLRG